MANLKQTALIGLMERMDLDLSSIHSIVSDKLTNASEKELRNHFAMVSTLADSCIAVLDSQKFGISEPVVARKKRKSKKVENVLAESLPVKVEEYVPPVKKERKKREPKVQIENQPVIVM